MRRSYIEVELSRGRRGWLALKAVVTIEQFDFEGKAPVLCPKATISLADGRNFTSVAPYDDVIELMKTSQRFKFLIPKV